MTRLIYPERDYLLSDTFGGQKTWNPLESPDIDAIITTDIRSGVTGIHRHFDTFGAAGISAHILRSISRLCRENHDGASTGVFINSAPRTTRGQNGEHFYLAKTAEDLRVVATPLSALSPLRERVTELYHLPNEHNELYTSREQFRSSLTVRLLAENHGLDLSEDDPDDIPELTTECKVSYVDRFGNIVIFDGEHPNESSLTNRIIKSIGQTIAVRIGKIIIETTVVGSLAEGNPGEKLIYANDEQIEIVGKWNADWDAHERLIKSAYSEFGHPAIGSPVDLA